MGEACAFMGMLQPRGRHWATLPCWAQAQRWKWPLFKATEALSLAHPLIVCEQDCSFSD
jgi:hypothetical protein